ncbi:MAG: alpha-amylase family glycosyl hydrolase, partial [candidate division KSB1 bacterium]|nr:alpha-amylase family glycosyl hydrolase [candidate division KSB1 bacterium]
MRRIKILFLFILPVFPGFAQILSWTPYFATIEDTITIIYDATQGSAGLVGAAEVYAHTGVITSQSVSPSDWKHVKTQWGQNTPATRMTPLGNDRWRIRFHIRSYYGIAPNETVLQLAFVFRSADAKQEGKTEDGGDIFLPLAKPGLDLALLSPFDSTGFVRLGDSLQIRLLAKEAQEIELLQDGRLKAQTAEDSLVYTFVGSEVGKYRFTAKAHGNGEKVLSFTCLVYHPEPIDLPADARDGVTDLGDRIRFVLFAPHHSFVYLIGDFNDWQAEPDYFMQPTPDGQRYWIELDHLQRGAEYAYQFWVDGRRRIADPYAEKILDPVHDSGISRSTFPDLKPYPYGRTSGIVSVVQPGKAGFAWQTTAFQRPPAEQLVIYELLVRDFTQEHSFAGVIEKLDYLQNLGVNAIELMPVNEFEGNSSWGYNPSFHFAVDKYYGPAEDLKRLVDEAHARGMAVILDVVLNHCYGQSPLVKLYLGRQHLNPWLNPISPNPVYAWGYDFNHESPATQAYVDRVLAYWLTEFRVDGFRFDFSKGFTNTPGDGWDYDGRRIALLKRLADTVRRIDPSIYLILEHFTDNREEKELAAAGFLLWGNLNAPFNEATMGWHDAGKSDFSWGLYTRRGWDAPRLVGYMESHDEERLMVKNLLYGNRSGSYNVRQLKTTLQRVEAAAAFLLLMPGPKMIWQFGELGYDVSIESNGRTGEKPIRWNYFDVPERRALYNAFAAFIRLKKRPEMLNPSVKSSFAPSFKWMSLT